MNDPFPSNPSAGPNATPTVESLLRAQESLQNSLNLVLVLLLILTGSLFIFFLREVSLARRQIIELRNAVTEYQKTTYPVIENFRSKLQAFAQTHPDFNAIYAKYFGSAAAAPFGGQPQPSNGPGAVRLPPGANH